jgi:hypothetical protein
MTEVRFGWSSTMGFSSITSSLLVLLCHSWDCAHRSETVIEVMTSFSRSVCTSGKLKAHGWGNSQLGTKSVLIGHFWDSCTCTQWNHYLSTWLATRLNGSYEETHMQARWAYFWLSFHNRNRSSSKIPSKQDPVGPFAEPPFKGEWTTHNLYLNRWLMLLIWLALWLVSALDVMARFGCC